VTLPVEGYQLKDISPRAYEHPADRAATAALASIPMLDTVVRKLIEFGYERALRQAVLGSSVRIGPDQRGDLWQVYEQVFRTLDLPEPLPDLYVTNTPFANALTFGSTRPVIVLNSGLVNAAESPDDIRVVLAHEAAHVLGDHVLYRTALQILLSLTLPQLPVLGGLPLRAVTYALLEWYRATELSCDRAAALVLRDPMPVCRLMMRLTGGVKDLDLDAYLRQASEYTEGGSGFDRVQRLFLDLGVTHALPVRRVKEVMDWVREGDFNRIVDGEYPRRGEPAPPPREEANEAVQFYSERFRQGFKDAGETLAGAGEQLTDWLRKQQQPPK
jgi:Zn-dependent protease with chaperone function